MGYLELVLVVAMTGLLYYTAATNGFMAAALLAGLITASILVLVLVEQPERPGQM